MNALYVSRRNALLWGGLALVPLVIKDDFYLDALIMIMLWAAVSGAWNIGGGYAGLVSLGHSAFFGIGAYTSALLFVRAGVSPWLGLLAGAGLSGGLGFILGGMTIRLKGPFFVLTTLAFAEVMKIIAINWHALTKGAEGLSVPFRPSLWNLVFYGKTGYFYVALVFLILTYGTSRWLDRSRLGYYLIAFRENARAAEAAGVDTVRTRLVALTLSAFFTAIGGSLYAQYVGFLEPEHAFAVHLSIQIALMTIIGGMGTAAGPIIGSILITSFSTFLRMTLGGAADGLHLVFYGLLLIAVVLFMPEGIVSWLSRRHSR